MTIVKRHRYISKIFSSIGVKLFFSFWLIAICAILATRFISAQFEQESVLLPAHKGDVRKLNRLSKRLNEKPLLTIEHLSKPKHLLKGAEIIIKDISSTKIHYTNKRFMRGIHDYLSKNNLDNLTSIQFRFARVTGPITVNLTGKTYQLYLATRSNPSRFNSLIMQLPFSARIAIPLLISMLLSWLLARSIIKPLLAMKNTATEFGDGDLTARVIKPSLRKDELGELAVSFNEMAEKIAINVDAHQRLLADVSHELRSPMTRLQIALALAHKSTEQPLELAQHLARCELEVSRLDQMINDVLSLSRLENSAQNLAFEPIDLVALIQSIITDEQYIADEKSITISHRLESNCQLLADAQLLSSAMSNVLSNAIKYSPECSSVDLIMKTSISHVSVTISDTGIGVPDSALTQLFKPFYRVSQARDRATGGTGLGLAIAQQAITAHNGSISAKNNDSGGLTITLILPLVFKNKAN